MAGILPTNVGMIATGTKVDTSIRFKALHNGEVTELSLADLLTRRTVVSVYMRNNTSSCDKQNTSLVTAADALSKAGYNLVAVSRDTCNSHLKYAEKMGINYTLVSDPKDVFSNAVDGIVQKSMYGKKYMGPARAAYVFETDGTLLAAIEKVDSPRHGDELLELIKGLK